MRRIFRIPTGRAGVAREVDEELAFHLEMRARQLVAAGLPPDAAASEARRQFGDLDSVRAGCITLDQERLRAMERANVLHELRHDLRYAARTLRRNWGFTLLVVLTLAVGIGANTAIFTLIDAVLLRPLPVPHPEELIALGNPRGVAAIYHSSDVSGDLFTYAEYRALQPASPLVRGIAASGVSGRLDVDIGRGDGELEHPTGRFVSGTYFAVLGVHAALGRAFDAGADAAVGAEPSVVISDGYWNRRFGRDPGVIGRSITIDGVPLAIAGVMPPGFFGEIVGQAPDIWIPITMQPLMMPRQPRLEDRQLRWLLLTARRAERASPAAAEAELRTRIRRVLADVVRADPEHTRMPAQLPLPVGSGAKGFSRLRADYAAPLLTLMIGVALLLLVVCANVANLLLARALGRGREMAVRLAIGAGRMRLVRQQLTESALLALLAAAAGLLLASWGSRLLLALASAGTAAVPLDVRIDARVLAFAAALAVAVIALFGIVPALRAARVDVAPVLRAQGRGAVGSGASRGRVPLGRVLMIGQVALSLVLLVGAALLVQSLRRIERTPTGLDRDHLLVMDLDAQARGYTGERLLTMVRELTARLQSVPGVAAVTFSEMGIFSGSDGSTTIGVPGVAVRTHDDSVVYFDEVGPGYVHAIGARLLAGRELTAADAEESAPVVLINQTMARFYFGDANPIGRRIEFTDSAYKRLDAEVVGVVADVKDRRLAATPVRRFYAGYLQHPGDVPPTELRIEIRAAGDPAALLPAIRRATREFDPQLPIDDLQPLAWLMRDSIAQERLLARLASGFGVLALLLTAVGLYGIMTYAVNRRTGELGLRIALGAEPGTVLRMVLGDALRIVGAGVGIGLGLGVVSLRLLGSQLHGIGTADPASIAVALAVLSTAALLAAFFPARRAGRVSPLVALQQE